MIPDYIIERWPHGWVLASAETSCRDGVPMPAMSECLKLFPKKAVCDSGIVHHLRQSGRVNAVMCIVTESAGREWRAEITKSLQGCEPQERWWRGLDVGTSSAAIFAVFCGSRWKMEAQQMGRASTPHDAADLGRCLRLLAMFPDWRGRLADVAAEYPDGDWPKLVGRWPELEAMPPVKQSEMLREILS